MTALLSQGDDQKNVKYAKIIQKVENPTEKVFYNQGLIQMKKVINLERCIFFYFYYFFCLLQFFKFIKKGRK
jgi:hypothetical protein